MTIYNWFSGGINQVERITVQSTGQVLTADRVDGLVQAMAAMPHSTVETGEVPAANLAQFNNLVAAAWQ